MTKTSLAYTLALSGILFLAGCAAPDHVAQSAQSAAEHNARTALDWSGTYRGMLPCADCEGIETTIVLQDDGHYQQQSRYVGKSSPVFNHQGSFTWDATGNRITLAGTEPEHYFVGEGWLLRLSPDGSRVTGPLAEHYRLSKVR